MGEAADTDDRSARRRARPPTPGARGSVTSPVRSPRSSGSPRTGARRCCSAPSGSSSPAPSPPPCSCCPCARGSTRSTSAGALRTPTWTTLQSVNARPAAGGQRAADRRGHPRRGARGARLPAVQRAPPDRSSTCPTCRPTCPTAGRTAPVEQILAFARRCPIAGRMRSGGDRVGRAEPERVARWASAAAERRRRARR